jgi:hypothetical protein
MGTKTKILYKTRDQKHFTQNIILMEIEWIQVVTTILTICIAPFSKIGEILNSDSNLINLNISR